MPNLEQYLPSPAISAVAALALGSLATLLPREQKTAIKVTVGLSALATLNTLWSMSVFMDHVDQQIADVNQSLKEFRAKDVSSASVSPSPSRAE